ncbi:uncharacterized protein ISCGN_027087 [Ixodes scapularis]
MARGSHALSLDLRCTTPGCVEHMALLNRTLSKKLSPCEDFSAFVCAGWKPQPPRATSVTDEMKWKWLADVYRLFFNGTLHLPRSVKARAVLKSCLGRPKSAPSRHLEQLKTFMRDRGIPWPVKPPTDKHPVDVLLDLEINWRCPMWFRARFLPDRTTRVLLVSPSKPPAFSREPSFELKDLKDIERGFLPDTLSLMKSFHGIYGSPYAPAATKMSAEIHVKIVKKLIAALRSGKDTRRHLQLRHIERLTPSVDAATWLQYLRAHTPSNFNLTMDTAVYVDNTDTLKSLALIMKEQSVEEILNVIGWQFALRYTHILAEDVPSTAVEDGAEKLFSFVCERQLSEMYGSLLPLEYVLGKFPIERRIEVLRFMKKVKSHVVSKALKMNPLQRQAVYPVSQLKFDVWPSNVIGGILRDAFPGNEASFMDYWIETRKASRSLLGTPEYDDLFNGLDNSEPPFSYRVHENALLVGLEVLSSPLYYVDVPDAIRYGGLGAILAGQIVRPFYNDTNVTSCGDPGLEVAFNLLRLEEPGEMSLRAARQFFFVAYCFSRCGSSDSTCNAALRSFEPFAETFSCSSSSYMGSSKKCTYF